MSATRALPPSSPFSLLLRRSRFATYDPAIAQVYTSPSSHVARGNWGLKRPLPLRRRNAFITVQAVDSNEQQSEFNRAENQARFIKRWEEAAGPAKPVNGSSWEKMLGEGRRGGEKVWEIDSEFCPWEETVEARAEDELEMEKAKAKAGLLGGERTGRKRVQGPIPNTQAMTHKQFERYIARLRELRPEFEAWLKDIARDDPRLQGKSLYTLSQDTQSGLHREFLAWRTAHFLKDPTSRNFEQKPHRNAALSYAHPSALQTLFTTEFQPGLVVQQNTFGNRNARGSQQENAFVVSFGGVGSTLKQANAGGQVALYNPNSQTGVRTIDSQALEDSVAKMRMLPDPQLADAPKVVGMRKEGLKAVRLVTQVTTDAKAHWKRDNPYRPGSRDYVAMESEKRARTLRVPSMSAAGSHSGVRTGKFKSKVTDASNFKAKSGANGGLLDTLSGILKVDNKDGSL